MSRLERYYLEDRLKIPFSRTLTIEALEAVQPPVEEVAKRPTIFPYEIGEGVNVREVSDQRQEGSK